MAAASVPTMPPAPGAVLDQDGLADFGLQLLGHHAGPDIGPAAGREGDDQAIHSSPCLWFSWPCFIVPFPPGGGTDVWARMVAEGMQAELGQPVLIENRAGGGGMVGTEVAAKAPPDGYTLLYNITTHVQAPVTFRRFPYDPVADFFPVGRLGTTAITFCVGPTVPAAVTTLAEFVEWGRNRDLAFGNYGQGSTGHAYALLLAQEAGLRVTQVAFAGRRRCCRTCSRAASMAASTACRPRAR